MYGWGFPFEGGLGFRGYTGIYKDITPLMESRMERKMENAMGTRPKSQVFQCESGLGVL